ncbi:MAG: TlpA family protein disulfide reductase [Actinobacteria bacterium]|nr:TlpA family protein disulfide reductase [Actinomycetota bacterium]
MTRRSTTRWAVAGVAVVIVALIGLLAVSKTQTDSAASPLLGKTAPPLAGKTLDGGSFDLTSMRGRFVVVNFFASWCQPCQEEAPELRRWAQRHQAKGDAQLVNVLFQDTPAAAEQFFARYGGATWPVLAVGTDTIGLDWGVAKVPETFVVNPQGVVVAKTITTVTESSLDDLLERGGATS